MKRILSVFILLVSSLAYLLRDSFGMNIPVLAP
jgi:hypothetical protein